MAAMGELLVAVGGLCIAIAAVVVPWALRAAAARVDLADRRGPARPAATAPSTPSAAPGWPSRCSARATAARPRTWCGASGADGLATRAFDFSYYVETRDDLGQVAPHPHPLHAA